MNLSKELIEFMGINEYGHENLLSFLVEDVHDLKEFMNHFFTGEIVRNIYAYQRYKRKKNSMTLDEFEMEWEKNKKMALETLLQEPIDVHMLSYMLNKNITQRDLYVKYTDNPNSSLSDLVKNNHSNLSFDEESLFEI